MITAILSLLLLVDATEASASTPAPTPAAKTAPAEEPKVCKREARPNRASATSASA